MNFPIYFWFELTALLVSLVLLKQIMRHRMIYFVPYLTLIVLYEYGTIKGWFTMEKSNVLSVNIITGIEFIFYGIFIKDFIPDVKKRMLISTIFWIIVVIITSNILFFQGYKKLHTHTLLLGNAFLVFLCCNFFYDMLEIETKTDAGIDYSRFWIVTGVLFFTLGQFAFFTFYEYMITSGNRAYRVLFDNISNFSNAILYSCIIIAIICQRKTTTSP